MRFYDKVNKLCNENGIPITSLAVSLGLSKGTPTGWKNGAIPRPDKIKAIADYFGVSTSYLLGESETACNTDCDTSASSTNNLTEHETALLDIFRKLDTINQAKLLVYASELQKQ